MKEFYIRVAFGEETETTNDITTGVSGEGTQWIPLEHSTDNTQFSFSFYIGLIVDPFLTFRIRKIRLQGNNLSKLLQMACVSTSGSKESLI